MSEMKRRLLAGELYLADDPELAADNARAQGLLERATRRATPSRSCATGCCASCSARWGRASS